MDKKKIIKKRLKLIRKKGDLYDVISQKRNATPDTFLRKLVKTHTFVFSRILYLFLVWTRRTKNKFAPVERIKKAQEEIRDYIDLPVDIFKTKDIFSREKDKNLGILYGDYNPVLRGKHVRPSREDLERDLRKILNFCGEYDINEIYIDEFFLSRYLSKKYLENYRHIYQSEMLCHKDEEVVSYLNIMVNPEELNDIIGKLKEDKYDNEYIYAFKDKINDQIIKDAIDDFVYDNDVNKLLIAVKSRLNLHINDEGIVKNRELGKLYQSYETGGPYLRVTVSDSNGKLVSRNIVSLYNYLEVADYANLEDRADRMTDNAEIDLIALLYLHLIGEKPKEVKDTNSINSLYDYIYNEYKEAGFKKKIPWIKTKLQRLEAEIPQFVVSFYSVVFALLLSLLLRFIPNHLPISGSLLNRYNNFLDRIESTYGDSRELESNMISRFKQFIEKFFPKKMAEEILDYAQEEMEYSSSNNTPKRVADIEWFTDDERPVYFVDQYSDQAYFYNGELDFYLRDPSVMYGEIVDCQPLFQVKTPIAKSEFDSLDEDYMFHIPLEVYPVGGDYALTQVIIKDEADPTKYVRVNEEWVDYNLWDFTEEEKEILKSMENPFVCYVYGLKENSSQLAIDNVDYTEENKNDVRAAILKGLGLDENATIDEINEKIASKGYTEYPLYNPSGEVDELEYYEKIASLDKIDINLAAVLTTVANDGYFYTVGYKNSNDDDCISTDEAYIWAMNEDGQIIDFVSPFLTEKLANEESANEWKTNQENTLDNSYIERNEEENNAWYSEKEDSEIKKVLDKIRLWAKEHHISYYLAAVLAVLIIKKIFGRKIMLKLKFKQAYRVLTDEELANTYAELLHFIYGEESMPIKRPSNEMIELIYKDFQALDDEEIDDLLKEIKGAIKESDNPDDLKKVEELLRIIPFMKERKEELKKSVTKKLSLK